MVGCVLNYKKIKVVTRSMGETYCRGFAKILGDGSKRIGLVNLHDMVERRLSRMSA